MKVQQKYLTYENLPSLKKGKKKSRKKAQAGKSLEAGMDNTPDPEYLSRYLGSLSNNIPASIPTEPSSLPRPDTNRIPLPSPQTTPPGLPSTPQQSYRPYDGRFGNAALLGLAAFDALLPNEYNKQTVVQPQMSYNPHPYGTGSQAIMKAGGGLSRKKDYGSKKKPYPKVKSKDFAGGHRSYPIPTRADAVDALRLAGLHGRDDVKRKVYAKYPELKKQTGGIIPDPMSNFSPHEYTHGGNVNGGADIRTVGVNYPNADLLEQWLLYNEGGPVPPPGRTVFNEVGAKYPNSDLLEQWIQYQKGGPVPPPGKTVFHDVGAKYPNSDLLEQWIKYPMGGIVNNTGYTDGEMTAMNPYNIIPGGDITMQDVSNRILGIPIKKGNVGRAIEMMPGQDYSFDADAVLELPMKGGGQLSPGKAKKILKDGKVRGKKLTAKQKKYFGMIAGGKSAQQGAQVDSREEYYKASAKLGHYKGILNERLKEKNPDAFKDYFKGLVDLRRSGKQKEAFDYIQKTPYNEYLTPEEVQSSLNNEDYADYLKSLRTVNQFESEQGRQPLFGTKEDSINLRDLNYGRRFASLMLTPSLSIYDKGSGSRYSRQYKYDPNKKEVDFTESGDVKLRPEYLSAPAITYGHGGEVYNHGGGMQTMWGGNADLESYNPYDGGTVAFNGASHEDGGIGMHYNGNPVEVEGGEFAAKDASGNLNIYGNMYVPGTKTKFKAAAKAMSKKEKRYDNLMTKGSDLVNGSNPANNFEQLAFNAGKVMMMGGKMGQQDIAMKKEKLSSLQKAMLDTAEEFGLEPISFSKGKNKKAKRGANIPFYQAGGAVNDPTMADRNNNPGNIKWGKFARKHGAKKGPPSTDGGYFAVFPTKEKGLQAMKSLLKSDTYKNLSIDEAIDKWTGRKPYNYNLDALGTQRKVGNLSDSELESMMREMRRGEGTRYPIESSTPVPTSNVKPPVVSPPPEYVPYGLPDIPIEQQRSPNDPKSVVPPIDRINIPPEREALPSNTEPLDINQVLGEIYGAATNRVEPVPAQRYEPQMYTPYQVSFQDRLNQNQAGFNAALRAIGSSNPSAIGALAAQKYSADSSVLGEEFRANQAISNDITNKNISLVNDANLKNLAIADTQMVRQSEARSKTKALNQMIVNSLSSKYAQNEYENKRLAAYENLYDYRFIPTEDGGLQAKYFGPNAMFNYSGRPEVGKEKDVRTISRYDSQGNLKGYAEYDDSYLKEQQRLIDIEMKKRKLPLLNVPPLR